MTRASRAAQSSSRSGRKRTAARSASGSYPGVSKRDGRWFEATYGKHHGKYRYLGRWLTAREAAIAVDRYELALGKKGSLRLPEVSRRLGPASAEELRSAARQKAKRSSKSRRLNTSRYLGVCWQNTFQRWEAVHYVGSRPVFLGHFDRERDAAVARDRYVLSLPRARAPLNFPSAGLEPASLWEIRAWARKLTNERGRTKRGPKPTSYEGVFRCHTKDRQWLAQFTLGRRTFPLGSWRTPEEAAIAYDRAVLHYLGEKAVLNFPERADRLVPADARELRAAATREYKKTTTSQYIGVFREKRHPEYWAAKVGVGRKTHVVGYFKDEERAAVERDKVALRLVGKKVRLNFDPRTGEPVFGARARELLPQRFERKRAYSARSS
jgi:hypothetical protein